ncbi:N-acetylglucosamine-specific PTS transporter subunit IIBC [Celerinatantimonas sp. YJH-8]|uniref:N-acetylglucosamine-specific PTS transporter subunit IIBC n=1 Tax=Celerinatantimonas sp. YJH-8 TaxID=3228714 RepID=UPI0038C42026
MNALGALQRLGRALMLPIAVMPVAALLLRIGQPDLTNITFIAQAGNAIFGHLALLFAIGVAVGLSKDNAGAAGLAGAVAYLVLTEALKTLNKDLDLQILGGIISGVVGGLSYNRYAGIKLPEFLGFFAGKRFVPIFSGLVSLILALLFYFIWPPIQHWIDLLGNWMVHAGELGGFVFGLLNRLLIPIGLHHILNTTAWFVFGQYQHADAAGQLLTATGDLNRFFAGDPNAGLFMTGFYPVMMFGLPAAALAMYRTAKPEHRGRVAGLLLGVALTAFLTGITEPLEFMFMFLAPLLYVFHAILTGLSLAICSYLGIHDGFGFSAGLFDYVLNWGLATKPGWLIPLGLVYALVYYSVFVWAIRKFDLKTPGREDMVETSVPAVASDGSDIGLNYAQALGGIDNLAQIDSCITRLRLVMVDRQKIDEPLLKQLGAKGIVKLGEQNLQVVIGPQAEHIAGELTALSKQSSH